MGSIPCMNKSTILFVQLPHLDNDAQGVVENVPLAAGYLAWSLEKAGLDRRVEPVIWREEWNGLDDSHLVEEIVSVRPAVIAGSLYVWNVERTLAILRQIKKRLPSVEIWLGGPEVAPDHPFLFKCAFVDAVVTGEGEPVFPAMVRHCLGEDRPAYRSIAWRKGGRFAWGKLPAPVYSLRDLLPPAGYRRTAPDSNGAAYMETSRGCPLKCMFCCYNQRREGVSFIGAGEAVRRVAALMKKGAHEIRFIDPTFNSNPEFESIIENLSRLNRRHAVTFFAELRAETVTRTQASLLSKANFTDIEVGVQSLDRRVLDKVFRHTSVRKVKRGVEMLAGRGIHLTIDIMNGLPGQTPGDLKKSLKWASGIRNSHIQFLHTLLIPGTRLRAERRRMGLTAQTLPPYRVLSTRTLSKRDMLAAEDLAEYYSETRSDCPSMRFAGTILPDLFPERVDMVVDGPHRTGVPPGRQNRRAVIFHGRDLFHNRDRIGGVIRKAVNLEPFMLWQFVMACQSEEPLDLFDSIVAILDEFPKHFLDRLTVTSAGNNRVARRLFVLLDKNRDYDRDWVRAVEDMLGSYFY